MTYLMIQKAKFLLSYCKT